ncbi:hypothetical protein [Shewanella surugensis]|uniref:Uncharacterized protein n=1 Tax=Shewanella surugensis TaxID=212020 RepID=A0ABT0LFK7_9GAMM|nr:hypothetical protein [Shewanella surugensis]MCL1126255.1 hypothetical protein [Shewanella surugensis]
MNNKMDTNSTFISSAGNKLQLNLSYVHCSVTGDHQNNGDDLYIKYRADSQTIDTRYPTDKGSVFVYDLKAGQNASMNIIIEFTNSVRVELYDVDGAGDESLGSVTYSTDDLLDVELIDDTNSPHDGQYQFHSSISTIAKKMVG